jgi:branched-chain amino acid transport system substrate-binding protein
VFYAKEAMEWADKNGGITSENIRKGMTQKKDWVPAALDGMCAPATWTDQDHRSVVNVEVVEGRSKDGKPGWNSLATINVGRDAKWWGK